MTDISEMDSSDSGDNEFAKRTKSLIDVVNSTKKNIDSKEKCFPTLLIVGIVAPFIVWALFYFIKPSFVQKKAADGTYQRDSRKLFMWTFIVTLVLWACLYLWTYCKGYDRFASVCSRK